MVAEVPSVLIDCVGTFDVANFGDLLYPHLVAQQFAHIPSVQVRVVAPTTAPVVGFDDAYPTQGMERWPPPDLAVVGGGNLIGANSPGVYGARTAMFYEGLICASGTAGTVWNGLGVMNANNRLSLRTLDLLGSGLPYCSVRDEPSADYLRRQIGDQDVHVIPDLAFGVARLWPRAPDRSDTTLDVEVGEMAPYMTVAVKDRELADVAVAAQCLDRVARSRQLSTVVLVASGPVHGDVEAVNRLASALRTGQRDLRVLTSRATTLRTACELLSGASLHVGNSLHGGVVSVAYGVPTLWVSNISARGNHKLDGVLPWSGSLGATVRSWSEAPEACDRLAVDPAAERRRDAALAGHWRSLKNVVDRIRTRLD